MSRLPGPFVWKSDCCCSGGIGLGKSSGRFPPVCEDAAGAGHFRHFPTAGAAILADYTAIYAVGNSLAQFLGNSFPAALKTQYPNVKFQLVSSSQVAEEDTTNLDQIVSIFLHRITYDQNFRTATRIPDE